MSDKGDKVCQICTEEMDLTDQQLKPCKCGYQICVWCWNHIMEMAEKDNTEGRCPACRTAYDKEKIVSAAESCERLVAEVNSERKLKTQKTKPKASEGKMHLCDTRVIQRNLVYIIGLPLNLADEDLLHRREYFGQYGKVLKVSISRTTTGAIQHSTNNSCCVYITYSKEDDAVVCIQSVHGFVVDGKPLRACFGTTKYCHAWLRNMPCITPDCMYLHDVGSEEDSFLKDDLVSAFQRSKVQQIIGSTNNMYRSGNVLPPPADHANCNRPSTGRPVADSSIVENQSKGSCTDGGGPGKSNALPVAGSWVMRVSGTVPPATNQSGSGGLPSSKPVISSSFQSLASEAVCAKRSTPDDSCKVHSNHKLDPLESAEERFNSSSCHIDLSNKSAGSISYKSPTHRFSGSEGIGGDISEPLSSGGSQVAPKPFCSVTSVADVAENVPSYWEFQGLCTGLSAVSNLSHLKNKCSSSQNMVDIYGSRGSVQDTSDQFERSSTSSHPNENTTSENLLIYEDRQMTCVEDILHLPSASESPCSLFNSTSSSYRSWQKEVFNYHNNPDPIPRVGYMNLDEISLPSNGFGHSYADRNGTFGYSNGLSEIRLGNYGCNKNIGMVDNNNVTSDSGENSIISKILSIDLDTWEYSLASPQSLVELLSDTDKHHGYRRVPSVRKIADGKQSRFSFARQEDFFNHRGDEGSTSSGLEENKGLHMHSYKNIFPSFSPPELDNNFSTFSNFPGTVSQSPNSTPPGFSMPCRPPPPGFASHVGTQRTFDNSATHSLQASPPMAHSIGSFGDIEFFDPAILELRKGMHRTGINDPGHDMRAYSSVQQLSPFDFDAGVQQLMHQSVSEHQSLTFANHLNTTSPQNENNCILPMFFEQFQPNRHSQFTQSSAKLFNNIHTSNGGWDLWSDAKAIGDMGGSREMKLNNFLPMPNSSNLYNREFAK